MSPWHLWALYEKCQKRSQKQLKNNNGPVYVFIENHNIINSFVSEILRDARTNGVQTNIVLLCITNYILIFVIQPLETNDFLFKITLYQMHNYKDQLIDSISIFPIKYFDKEIVVKIFLLDLCSIYMGSQNQARFLNNCIFKTRSLFYNTQFLSLALCL